MRFKIQTDGKNDQAVRSVIRQGGDCLKTFNGQEIDIPLDSLSPFLRKQVAENVSAGKNDESCPSLRISEHKPYINTKLINAVMCDLAQNGIRETEPGDKYQFKGESSEFMKYFFNRLSSQNEWCGREGWAASQVGGRNKVAARLSAAFSMPTIISIILIWLLALIHEITGLEWVGNFAIVCVGLMVLIAAIQVARIDSEMRQWEKVLDAYLENIDLLKREYFDFIIEEGVKVGADRESLEKLLYDRVKFPYEDSEKKKNTQTWMREAKMLMKSLGAKKPGY